MQKAIPQELYIETPDISLHYRKSGSGEPLILLHGWLQTHEFWKPYIEEFGREHEVYAVDLRGHGKTSVLSMPETDAMTQSHGISFRDFSIRKASEDIVHLIHKLNLQKVKAIGLSYGGLVLLEMMAAHPGLIEKAVLIGVSNRYDGKKAAAGKPPFRFDDLDPGFRDMLLREHAFGEQQVRALFDPEIDYNIDIGADQLSRIKTRVLVINGDRDEMTGIDGAVEIFKHVPESSLWIIPGTGHMVLNEENREEFIIKTLNFLNKP